ncbi:hypothetical protein [Saccharothrix stipae]
MATPTLIPDGFLKQVLDEFGIQWTHLSILSAAVVSILGLEKYVNIGLWILVTISAFCIVYVFRRQVSGNFPRAVLISTPLILILIVAPLLVLKSVAIEIPPWLQANRLSVTLYLAVAIMIPVAYLLLSYRVQEEQFGGPYPREIRDAIRTEVVELPFYRKNQVYDLEVLKVEQNTLTMRMKLSYVLVNRTKSARELAPGVAPGLRTIRPVKVTVAGKDIDLTDPEIMTERGMRVPRLFGAGSETDIEFIVDVDYQARDNDLYTSWIPSTSLTLRITNKYPISFHVEHLMQGRVDPTADGNTVEYRVDHAILPFQGFRMTWLDKRGTT